MRSKSHIAKLKDGVRGWNNWRKKNPNTVVDLSRENLNAANLFGANLSDINLSKSNLLYDKCM